MGNGENNKDNKEKSCASVATFARKTGQTIFNVYRKISHGLMPSFKVTKKKIFIFTENDRPKVDGLREYLLEKYGYTMSIKELSEEFQSEISTFKAVAKKGYLPGKKDLFGYWQFKTEDVINYIYGLSF